MKKTEMKVFLWKGFDKQGKEISGQDSAPSDVVLKAYLQKQGLNNVSVKEKPRPIGGERKGRIKSRDIVFFSRQMATMLRAGMPLIRALELVGQSIEKPKRMQDLVLDLSGSIQNGSTFADALRKHSLYFDDLYISLVAAGEEAGQLEKTFDDISTNLEKAEVTKKKIKKALTYPVIVLLFSVVVTAILMIKVVPVFADFFVNNGGELPALTQMVVNISNFFVEKGVYMLIGIVAAIFFFFFFKKRNKKFRDKVNAFSLKIPLIGGILRCGANARFARTISVLFDSGVPLMSGLTVTAPATGNPIYEAAVLRIREDVQNGQQMSFAMKNVGLFPNIAVQMTAIGEESGNLGEMLGRVGKFYEEELDWRIDNLTQLIEPAIMAFLAVVVGGLLVAMYLPIFNLGNLF